jgi:hypothetical protein
MERKMAYKKVDFYSAQKLILLILHTGLRLKIFTC